MNDILGVRVEGRKKRGPETESYGKASFEGVKENNMASEGGQEVSLELQKKSISDEGSWSQAWKSRELRMMSLG